ARPEAPARVAIRRAETAAVFARLRMRPALPASTRLHTVAAYPHYRSRCPSAPGATSSAFGPKRSLRRKLLQAVEGVFFSGLRFEARFLSDWQPQRVQVKEATGRGRLRHRSEQDRGIGAAGRRSCRRGITSPRSRPAYQRTD